MKYKDQVEEVLTAMCTTPEMTVEQSKESVEAMLDMSGLTREGLNDDIIEGISLGYSVEEQIKQAKDLIKQLDGPLNWIEIKAENDSAEEE